MSRSDRSTTSHVSSSHSLWLRVWSGVCAVALGIQMPACLDSGDMRSGGADTGGFSEVGADEFRHQSDPDEPVSREHPADRLPPSLADIEDALPPEVVQARDLHRRIEPVGDPVDIWRANQQTDSPDPTEPFGNTPGVMSVDGAGNAAYTYPIETPPGSGGLTPQIHLIYNSAGERGWLGKGWSLSTPGAIVRCNSHAALDVRSGTGGGYSGDLRKLRRTFCLNGQPLVRVDGRDLGDVDPSIGSAGATELEVHAIPVGEYRTLPDSGVRVTYVSDDPSSGDGVFTVRARNGVDTIYNKLPGSGRWRPTRQEDGVGNFVDFIYSEPALNDKEYNADQLESVVYGNEGRASGSPYPESSYRRIEFKSWVSSDPDQKLPMFMSWGGERFSATRDYVGCVDTFAPDGPGGQRKIVHRYKLKYDQNHLNGNPRLVGIQKCGYEKGAIPPVGCTPQGDPSPAGEVCEPQTTFSYSTQDGRATLENAGWLDTDGDPDFRDIILGSSTVQDFGLFEKYGNISSTDINGDGRSDLTWAWGRGLEQQVETPEGIDRIAEVSDTGSGWSYRLSTGSDLLPEVEISGLPTWNETRGSFYITGARGNGTSGILVLTFRMSKMAFR